VVLGVLLGHGENAMTLRKSLLATLILTVVAWATLPETSHAQIFRRGRGYSNGYGGGYYNGGYYNGGYNSGYYGANSGYYPGQAYNGSGSIQQMGYSGGYDPCCCQQGMGQMGPAYGQGMQGTLGQGQMSMYPPNQNGTAGNITVNVPANAELWWNGQRTNETGTVRHFPYPTTGADGVQRFEARWPGPDGKTISQSREIRLNSNTPANVDFNSQTGVNSNINNNTNTPNGNNINTPNGNNTNTPNGANPLPGGQNTNPDRR